MRGIGEAKAVLTIGTEEEEAAAVGHIFVAVLDAIISMTTHTVEMIIDHPVTAITIKTAGTIIHRVRIIENRTIVRAIVSIIKIRDVSTKLTSGRVVEFECEAPI